MTLASTMPETDPLPPLHLERLSHEVILRSVARTLSTRHRGSFGAEIAALERVADDLVARTYHEKATA